MIESPRLSCLVVAHNEEADLPDCLATLGFADEVLVVLDRCTDRSKEIAQTAGATLLEGAWEVQGDRRNEGIQACAGDWILEVDADERVPETLGREVRQTIQSSQFDYHRVRIDNYVGERLVRNGWGASFGRRSHPGLFRKGIKTWGNQRVHPSLMFKEGAHEGPPLTAPIAHYGFDGITDLIGRLNRYSDRHAADLRDAGDFGTALDNYRRIVSRFWKCFVARKGYQEGGIGFVIAICAALYPILSYLKAKYDQ
ncbi:glycosyltransferase family 2 protein [Rhodovibrio salinarum]|uniref:Glycosyltransferase family 2 protein n=1 Tax=Rhodovibrio salinarum TaxID=1087 RepID=A0A934V0B5_9PROT|nr:glycosyltransferase family 2 protein [Rhodovibrio salinarum]MBK1697451.1 glycosyltransferase family 2 protein [Rhodovibrio salinarum]